MLKFTKVDRGWYATEDGTWCVVVDGYERSNHAGKDTNWTPSSRGNQYEGFVGGEWATVYDAAGRLREDHGAGANLDWFATKREAIEHAQYEAARRH